MSRTEIGSLSTVFEKNKRINDEEIRRIEQEKQAKRRLQKSREKQNDHQKSYHDSIKAAKNAEIVKNLQNKKSAEILIPDKYRVKKPVKDKHDASQNIKSNGFTIDTKRQAPSREDVVKMRQKMQSPDGKVKKSEKRVSSKKSDDEDVPKKKKKKTDKKSELRSKMSVSSDSDDHESVRIKKKEKKHKKEKSERDGSEKFNRPDKHREKYREKSEKQEKRDRHEKHRKERSERSEKPSKHLLPPSKKATGTNKSVDLHSL